MNRFGRKVSALVLAAAVTVASVVPAFAANSPVSGKSDSSTTVNATVNKDGKSVTVKSISSTGKSATIPASVKSGGKNYSVSEIKTNSIQKKYNKVTIVMNDKTKVDAKIVKSKNAKKTKKIVITATNGKKLNASQFNKKAFKGFKGKIIVKKSAMTKKQFKKLAKKLRKGGFKGKIAWKK